MDQKARSELLNRTPPAGISVFFAGNHPLRALSERVIGWLRDHDFAPEIVDIEQDDQLRGLLQAPQATTHLPILCADGRIIGAGDPLLDLIDSGQLEALLREPLSATQPQIAVSPAALAVWQGALGSPSEDVIRISVSSAFEHELGVDSLHPDDLLFDIGGVRVALDPASALRANGLAIDWVEEGEVRGFRINNPSQPSTSHEIDCETLSQVLEADTTPLIIDVRTPDEHQREHIAPSRLLDSGLVDALGLLDRRTPLLFYCDNGRRSQRAAQRYVEQGFSNVAVLKGGLNAWKLHLANAQPIG